MERQPFVRTVATLRAADGDADDAHVELTLGDGTHTRQLRRGTGGIVADGDPYLDDPELTDLFAFLLESNEPRRRQGRRPARTRHAAGRHRGDSTRTRTNA